MSWIAASIEIRRLRKLTTNFYVCECRLKCRLSESGRVGPEIKVHRRLPSRTGPDRGLFGDSLRRSFSVLPLPAGMGQERYADRRELYRPCMHSRRIEARQLGVLHSVLLRDDVLGLLKFDFYLRGNVTIAQ